MLFSGGEFCRQRSSWRRRRCHFDESEERRELLFALLPALFAVHQFIEGVVWLGLDGILSPVVTHKMGAAYMLYAQGLLPFLLPVSVLLFEPNGKSRRRMVPFLVIGGATGLYVLWGLTAYPTEIYVRDNSIVYINQATNNMAVAVLYVIATCGSLIFSKVRAMVVFGVANLAILLIVDADQAIRVYLCVVRVCGGRKRNRPRLLLEEQQTPAIALCASWMKAPFRSSIPAIPTRSRHLTFFPPT